MEKHIFLTFLALKSEGKNYSEGVENGQTERDQVMERPTFHLGELGGY
jgi:hypothetical protein